MKFAITGATGFVGTELVHQACAAGYAVRVLARDSRQNRAFAAAHGVELFPGDVTEPQSLRGVFEGVNCVGHLVGIIVERGRNTFDRVHVAGTRHVLAATAAAGVRRYLHMSALGTRAGARSRYHQTKWAAEQLVRESGLAWTIFRPSLIYGQRDQLLNQLFTIVRRAPVVPVPGNGAALVQPVAVENVAQAFLSALRNDAAIGRTYELCGPRPVSWNELYAVLRQVAGNRKRLWHVPLPLARALATLAQRLPNPPVTREQLLLLEENNIGDPQPAERELGLSFEPFTEGVARCFNRR